MFRLRVGELEKLNAELKLEVKDRDITVAKLKETLRQRETQHDEYLAKVKVLEDELASEQENKMKCERMLEQHKLEIRDLQLKLDDCVNETKRLVSVEFPSIHI